MTMPSNERLFFTRNEVAKLLGISKRTLVKWIKNHDIEEIRVGAISRISRTELDCLGREDRRD